jgi:hypothetical protein
MPEIYQKKDEKIKKKYHRKAREAKDKEKE